ncbi:MAG: sigma-70 family RNA polymerase sigma factor [Lachnospiraceae bacterium]|nr:sigma-70 family RNA polymerase sigma factor [Lachnospiraceae bacterium]
MLNPEHRTIEEETNLEIRRAVRRLPEKYRQPVILYYSADLKTKEISECLRISENTVKTRLRKARELLKKELEGKIYG